MNQHSEPLDSHSKCISSHKYGALTIITEDLPREVAKCTKYFI